MTSRHARRSSVALALAAAGTLALTACGGGGGGFSSQSTATQKAGPANLKIMIGSSGDAETAAVKAAADGWAKKSGNTVEVIAASDLSQQLGQALRRRHPAGRLLHRRRALRRLRQGRQPLRRTATRSRTPSDFYPRCVRPSPTTASSTARPRTSPRWRSDQHRPVDQGRPDRRRHPHDWDELETVAKKLTKGKVTGLVIGDDRRPRSARSWCRPAAGWSTRTAARSPPTPRRTWPACRVRQEDARGRAR